MRSSIGTKSCRETVCYGTFIKTFAGIGSMELDTMPLPEFLSSWCENTSDAIRKVVTPWRILRSTEKMIPYVMLLSIETFTASSTTLFPNTNLSFTTSTILCLLKNTAATVVMASRVR